MTNKDLNNWIMYHEIHRLSRLGFKVARIARYLGLDRRTVDKRLSMDEQEYEQSLLNNEVRFKKLALYEDFVKTKLEFFEDTSTAQMFDWLKEHYVDLPDVSVRTVYNFVMFIRQKYNIPIVPSQREYFSIEELPYGYQAQVDFGVYNMRVAPGRQKKVWFFSMVLARSRYKYVVFSDKSFTAKSVCQAHEETFRYFGGIPQMIVYDQDRTMMVDENLGQLLLTADFSQYSKARGYKLYFCRKADPETKGKVERVIQYVKKNFLYNRTYSDLETLNNQVLAWLSRTANYLEHHVTKTKPIEAFQIEKTYLNTYQPLAMDNINEKTDKYLVRKDNTVNYKGNFYSVPVGTFKGSDTYTVLSIREDHLYIYNLDMEQICVHTIPQSAGNKVINTNHRRDHSLSIEQLLDEVSGYFTDMVSAKFFLNKLKKNYPRYIRDQAQAVLKAVKSGNIVIADKTLAFCLKNQVFNALDFEQIYNVFITETDSIPHPSPTIQLLDKGNLEKASETPQKSNLEDYENIFNN